MHAQLNHKGCRHATRCPPRPKGAGDACLQRVWMQQQDRSGERGKPRKNTRHAEPIKNEGATQAMRNTQPRLVSLAASRARQRWCKPWPLGADGASTIPSPNPPTRDPSTHICRRGAAGRAARRWQQRRAAAARVRVWKVWAASGLGASYGPSPLARGWNGGAPLGVIHQKPWHFSGSCCCCSCCSAAAAAAAAPSSAAAARQQHQTQTRAPCSTPILLVVTPPCPPPQCTPSVPLGEEGAWQQCGGCLLNGDVKGVRPRSPSSRL